MHEIISLNNAASQGVKVVDQLTQALGLPRNLLPENDEITHAYKNSRVN
ncbi:hypothetical protein CDA65_02288 [Lacticaseibacillus paracasei]|nr:hypothetical protein CDA65_02288 [Lacticaseibacillus paracasei]